MKVALDEAKSLARPLLERLVAVPSWDEAGEAECLRLLQDWLGRQGIPSELHQDDAGRTLSLVSAIRKSDEPHRRLVFNSHVDTVPISNRAAWRNDPLHVTADGESLTGLGVADAKGSAAAMACAFAALYHDWDGPANVQLMIVGGEERGGLGTRMEIKRGMAGSVIVGEPTSLVPRLASKGVLRLDVSIHGKAAHASQPQAGVNAIYPAGALLVALEKLAARIHERTERWTGRSSLAVTLIDGGTAQNVVPARCTFHIDRRLLPGETADGAQQEVEEIVREVAAKYPDVRFEVSRLRVLLPVLVSEDAPVVRTAVRAARAMGGPAPGSPELAGFEACCDLCFIANEGEKLPGVIWGPGSLDQAHQVNETLSARELELAVSAYYEAARTWQRTMG